MGQLQEQLPPIEEVFNPNSPEYVDNPVPQCLALLKRGRLVWYEPWQAWIMTRMPDILECWKHEPLSSDFYDWEFAPPRPPADRWSNFERAMIGHSLLADPDHHRLVRKVVSPAFSRNVVDKIQAAIEPDVKRLFDELGTPEVFDYKSEIAQHIPFISITRMVGVPETYWPQMKRVIMSFTETWNPTISDAWLGISMPTTSRPGMGASMRMLRAARAMARSSARPSMRLSLMRASGRTSYWVTTGPVLVPTTVAGMANERSFSSMMRTLRS